MEIKDRETPEFDWNLLIFFRCICISLVTVLSQRDSLCAGASAGMEDDAA